MKKNTLNYINFTQDELKELFSNAKNGDSKSFALLSKYIRNISHSYFLSKLRLGKITNKDDVDDLTNDVYLSFAEQYQKIDNLEFWLRRVLFLTFVNWYKKSRLKLTLELDESYFINSKNYYPGDSIDSQQILKIINKLSAEKQAIIKMRFWEELKFQEIADKLNKNEAAVKKMFYRTMEEIKNKL